jgi:hypothetical protein
MYKHYIRINENSEVIGAFSSAFQNPQEGDILLVETEERHFNLTLTTECVARYTWDGKRLAERTTQEIDMLALSSKEKASALNRLSALDVVIQRGVEDLYTHTNAKPVGKTADAIAEKTALRLKLKSADK